MEERSKVNGSALFVTENSLQSSLLKDSLEERLNLSFNLISMKNVLNGKMDERLLPADFMVIDVSVLSEGEINQYFQLRNTTFPNCYEVLINCHDNVEYKDLIKWKNLVGVFYSHDTLDQLIQGITKVLDGEMWFSRKLAHEYIRFYRARQSTNTSSSYALLTNREQQIIKLLGNGASNYEIAQSLFVSENTVKTHLHNVFKKINVKNRLQALIWVKENVGSEEFV